MWIHDKNETTDNLQWKAFIAEVNNGGLTWEFLERSQEVDFIDTTITITGNIIETNLFKKSMVLHLYIPDNNAILPRASTVWLMI